VTELWKGIVGFPDYEVSSAGRVRRHGCNPPRILNGWAHNACHRNGEPMGYVGITLRKDGKKHSLLLHRIVAEAFLPNPNNLPTVNHKKGMGNDADNLEWASAERQMIHAMKTGLHDVKGYGFHKQKGAWRAYIQVKGKHIHLGLFPTEAEAKMARQSAEKEYQQLEGIL